MSKSIKVRSQFSDIDNQWTAGVFVDGQAKPVCTATATTKFEAEGQAADKYRKERCKPNGISELRPIIQDRMAQREEAKFDAAAVTNIQITPDEYQIDTCTMVTTKQTNGHYKCVLTPLGHSAGYVGYSPSKIGSEVEAVKSYRKYNDTRNSQPKVEPNTLASDLREQEKVMAGLIEKAKRTGLDHRLIAMANTDFERGFMALDKALTTNKG